MQASPVLAGGMVGAGDEADKKPRPVGPIKATHKSNDDSKGGNDKNKVRAKNLLLKLKTKIKLLINKARCMFVKIHVSVLQIWCLCTVVGKIMLLKPTVYQKLKEML